jgi:hypothetical protein
MKKLMSSIIGGIAGAVSLNILHQIVQYLDHDVPRLDLVDEEALADSLKMAGIAPLTGKNLFAVLWRRIC